MKQTNLTAPSYDEASSSGEEDDSSSSSSHEEEDDDEEEAGTSAGAIEHTRSRRHSQKGESNSSDNDDDDEDDASSSEEESQGEHPRVSMDSEDDDDDDDEEEDHPPADLTLQEQLERNETRGFQTILRQQRERKRTALEIASERLATFKKQKKSSTQHQRGHTKTPGGADEYDDNDDDDPPTNATAHLHKRKKSKHAPTEVSSKRSDFFRRGPLRLNESGLGIEIGANRYKPLDPRTNSLNGHLNEEHFEKSYEFLQEMRDKEILQLKKKIGARKETGKKGKRKRRQLNISGGSIEEDESRLLQLKQEKADFERRKIDRAAKRTVKNTIKTEVEEGKRGIYFLKRKEKKKLEFEAKIDELRKRGGHKAAEKALEKRRKKAKSRDSSMFAK